MTVERVVTATDLRAADFADFATMRQVADAVRHPRDHGLVTAEYWKSAPYFLDVRRRIPARPATRGGRRRPPSCATCSASSHHVERSALERFEPLEAGNARMRVLAGDTSTRAGGAAVDARRR